MKIIFGMHFCIIFAIFYVLSSDNISQGMLLYAYPVILSEKC